MSGTGLRLAGLLGAAVSLGGATAAQGELHVLLPSRDNTLIEEASGALSNGAGPVFHAGRVGMNGGGLRRRGVVAFDVAGSVPAGATVERAFLTLHVAASNTGDRTIGVHPLTSDWGEGTSFAAGGTGAASTQDDATWLHTFYPASNWTTPGGDFVAGASATATVGGIGSYTWTSSALVADVQGWLDYPSTNHGWILLGDETTTQTVKGFDSRESANGLFRPRLTIYTGPTGRPKPRLASGTPSPGGTLTPLVVSGTPGSRLRIELGEPGAAGVVPVVSLGGRIFAGPPSSGRGEPLTVEIFVPGDPRLVGCRVRAQGVVLGNPDGVRLRAARTYGITIEIEE